MCAIMGACVLIDVCLTYVWMLARSIILWFYYKEMWFVEQRHEFVLVIYESFVIYINLMKKLNVNIGQQSTLVLFYVEILSTFCGFESQTLQ